MHTHTQFKNTLKPFLACSGAEIVKFLCFIVYSYSLSLSLSLQLLHIFAHTYDLQHKKMIISLISSPGQARTILSVFLAFIYVCLMRERKEGILVLNLIKLHKVFSCLINYKSWKSLIKVHKVFSCLIN